jgi:hypothetical protein
VRGNNNEVVGAIEVLVPQYRAKIDALLPKLEEAATQLSTALGASKSGLTTSLEKEVIPPQTTGQIPTAQTPPAGMGTTIATRATK